MSSTDGTTEVRLKVKTLDESVLSVTLAADNLSVTALKNAILHATGGSIPVSRQRIIFRGKILADGSPLSAYGIVDDDTVHLVARAADETVASPDYTALLAAGSQRAAVPSPLVLSSREFESTAAITVGATPGAAAVARILSAVTLAGVGSGVQVPTEGIPRPHAPEDARFSSTINHDWAHQSATTRALNNISQTLHTMHTVSTAMGITPASDVEQVALNAVEEAQMLNSTTPGDRPRTTIAFVSDDDRSVKCQRYFHVGQYVDALDTVEQWLEAVIMRVRQAHVYVHYCGWPERWDEWIRADSPRLAPIRTRSLHTTLGFALSPQLVNILPSDYVAPLPPCPSSSRMDDVSAAVLDGSQRVIHVRDKATRTTKAVTVSLQANDVRRVLPGVAAAARSLSGMLDALVAACEQQIVSYAGCVARGSGERDSPIDELADIQPVADAASAAVDSTRAAANVSTEEADTRVKDVSVAASVLLDKFGRAMADLAPVIERLAAAPTFSSQCATTTTNDYDYKQSEDGHVVQHSSAAAVSPSPALVAEATASGYRTLIKPPQTSPWPDDADPRLRASPGYGVTLAGDRSVSLIHLSHAARQQRQNYRYRIIPRETTTILPQHPSILPSTLVSHALHEQLRQQQQPRMAPSSPPPMRRNPYLSDTDDTPVSTPRSLTPHPRLPTALDALRAQIVAGGSSSGEETSQPSEDEEEGGGMF